MLHSILRASDISPNLTASFGATRVWLGSRRYHGIHQGQLLAHRIVIEAILQIRASQHSPACSCLVLVRLISSSTFRVKVGRQARRQCVCSVLEGDQQQLTVPHGAASSFGCPIVMVVVEYIKPNWRATRQGRANAEPFDMGESGSRVTVSGELRSSWKLGHQGFSWMYARSGVTSRSYRISCCREWVDNTLVHLTMRCQAPYHQMWSFLPRDPLTATTPRMMTLGQPPWTARLSTFELLFPAFPASKPHLD